MPSFECNNEIKVDVDDFLYACDKSEIQEIINCLRDDGHIIEEEIITGLNRNNIFDDELNGYLKKISTNRLKLTNEDISILKKLTDKF